MTATFGKLEHETLTLEPGLNILEAPNEWGKSTWCAFLVAMLYGIDTRSKTTKATLADKERYAPWSGAPMEGRIDLNWNGRDITIQRRSKGRLIFGDFRAYETESGLDIPELNGFSCGQMLLGVERSVFLRAGFLRLTDLPVTQDDALRRRLNNLVTTGDESGAGDKLAQTLKDLKNKCRYNRSGLLPQAEAQRDQLEQQLYQLQDLKNQTEAAQLRQKELSRRIALLENHKEALAYEAAREDAQRLEQAEESFLNCQQRTQGLEAQCAKLPDEVTAEQALKTITTLQQRWMALQQEARSLPPRPEPEDIPDRYLDLSPEDAVALAAADTAELNRLRKQQKKNATLVRAAMFAGILLAAVLFLLRNALSLGLMFGLLGGIAVLLVAATILLVSRNNRLRNAIRQLCLRRNPLAPDQWVPDAEAFALRRKDYIADRSRWETLKNSLNTRQQALDQEITAFAGEKTLGQCQDEWNRVAGLHRILLDARREQQNAQELLETLRPMVRIVNPPTEPDSLAFTREETDALLSSALSARSQNQLRLGQLQGQAETLGLEEQLRQKLRATKQRIAQLEDYYHALELAQNALHAATSELQRRFAPRIAKRAQTLFGLLTGNRYDRLRLSEDLSLSVGTTEEDTLRASLWRSDGTVDQLYLALRLAVAEELTPDAPLILDDALVRFDDSRLAAAMKILKETGRQKQILLFTCQRREKDLSE